MRVVYGGKLRLSIAVAREIGHFDGITHKDMPYKPLALAFPSLYHMSDGIIKLKLIVSNQKLK